MPLFDGHRPGRRRDHDDHDSKKGSHSGRGHRRPRRDGSSNGGGRPHRDNSNGGNPTRRGLLPF